MHSKSQNNNQQLQTQPDLSLSTQLLLQKLNNQKQQLLIQTSVIQKQKVNHQNQHTIPFKPSRVYPEEIAQPQNKNYYTICETCNNWIEDPIYQTHKRWHSTKIIDNLYLGSSITSSNIRQLRVLNVTAILNCAQEIPNTFMQDSDFIYKKLTLTDNIGDQIKHTFNQCIQFINECFMKGRSVLVHCAMGKSRSASIVLVYLMVQKKMTLRRAYQFIKQKRPSIVPNPSYVKQLLELQLEIFGQNSIKPEQIRSSHKHKQNV